MHIAQIGTGRVGRPTAYTIMCSELASTLTVCDTKTGLAAAFGEELRHVAASLQVDVEINACERDEEVSGADIILISAGQPRIPGAKMSRRDLAIENARVVGSIAKATTSNNPGAKFVVITNPVDAMAMVCSKFSGADFVISAGTNLESLRFRSKLARNLRVPVGKVVGWVGGEHGDAAVTLWSTVRVDDVPVGEYLRTRGGALNRAEIDSYVKSVSKLIVDNIGGTEYGPAASFRDIVRAIVHDTNDVLSVAVPIKFDAFPQYVWVSVPVHLGRSGFSPLYEILSDEEKEGVQQAARAIYQTYETAARALE